jgi:hypothetical protein
MNTLGASDIDHQFSVVGDPASFTDSVGILHESYAAVDEGDDEVATAEGGTIAARVIVATYKTDVFPGLKAGDTLTLNGTDYRVTQVRVGGPNGNDAALTRAWCARKT